MKKEGGFQDDSGPPEVGDLQPRQPLSGVLSMCMCICVCACACMCVMALSSGHCLYHTGSMAGHPRNQETASLRVGPVFSLHPAQDGEPCLWESEPSSFHQILQDINFHSKMYSHLCHTCICMCTYVYIHTLTCVFLFFFLQLHLHLIKARDRTHVLTETIVRLLTH